MPMAYSKADSTLDPTGAWRLSKVRGLNGRPDAKILA